MPRISRGTSSHTLQLMPLRFGTSLSLEDVLSIGVMTNMALPPRLPQRRDRSDHDFQHLSCLDNSMTLQVPQDAETRPREIELGLAETKLTTLVSRMREEQCSEKLVSETREAYMILSRLEKPTDAEAQESLCKLSSESLEKAMWLVRNVSNTVDEMRMVQDKMMRQVVQVQTWIYELLKAGEKAEETRKNIAKADGEQAEMDAAMTAARSVHFVASPVVCQEDVHQASAFQILRDAVLDVNPTDDQDLFLQTALLSGAACHADHSTFAPVLPCVDLPCLSLPQTAALAAGGS